MVVRTSYMEAEQETKLDKIKKLRRHTRWYYVGTVVEARVARETARLEYNSAKTRDVTTHKRDFDPAVTNSSRTVMEKCPQTKINQDKCQFGTNEAHSEYCQHRARSVASIEHDAGKIR